MTNTTAPPVPEIRIQLDERLEQDKIGRVGVITMHDALSGLLDDIDEREHEGVRSMTTAQVRLIIWEAIR